MDWEGSAQEAGEGESGRSLRHLMCVTAFEFCNMLHMQCVWCGEHVVWLRGVLLSWTGRAQHVRRGEVSQLRAHMAYNLSFNKCESE